MSRLIRLALILGLSLTAVPSFAEDEAALAADAGAVTQDTGADVSAPADASIPADPAAATDASPLAADAAPATPAPVAPPALKPITITFSGEVASVSASETPPMITVQDRYGVKKEISVPAEAKITAGEAAKAIGDMKAGDKVTVEYTYDVATGKRTALSITSGDAAAAQPAA